MCKWLCRKGGRVLHGSCKICVQRECPTVIRFELRDKKLFSCCVTRTSVKYNEIGKGGIEEIPKARIIEAASCSGRFSVVIAPESDGNPSF